MPELSIEDQSLGVFTDTLAGFAILGQDEYLMDNGECHGNGVSLLEAGPA